MKVGFRIVTFLALVSVWDSAPHPINNSKYKNEFFVVPSFMVLRLVASGPLYTLSSKLTLTKKMEQYVQLQLDEYSDAIAPIKMLSASSVLSEFFSLDRGCARLFFSGNPSLDESFSSP